MGIWVDITSHCSGIGQTVHVNQDFGYPEGWTGLSTPVTWSATPPEGSHWVSLRLSWFYQSETGHAIAFAGGLLTSYSNPIDLTPLLSVGTYSSTYWLYGGAGFDITPDNPLGSVAVETNPNTPTISGISGQITAHAVDGSPNATLVLQKVEVYQISGTFVDWTAKFYPGWIAYEPPL